MPTTVKLRDEETIKRLDAKQAELGLDTRSNLVEKILEKGLDFLDSCGWEELLKIPWDNKRRNRD
jgi:hypothetical protein